MALLFERRHNMCAILDTGLPGAHHFEEMINFLRRSRIFHAITLNLVLCETHLNHFWNTATYDSISDPPALVATVAGSEIRVTEALIRQVLHFNDTDADRMEFPLTLIRGFFQRIGYVGSFNDSQLRKAKVSSVWRFLMHTLIMCLSARKAGFDGMGQALQSAMVALVLNKPYNFTRYVFTNMRQNTGAHPQKFLIFSRFVQLCINARLLNLQPEGLSNQIFSMTKRTFADCRQYGRNEEPAPVELFGHIINEQYQAPPDDNFESHVQSKDGNDDEEEEDDDEEEEDDDEKQEE